MKKWNVYRFHTGSNRYAYSKVSVHNSFWQNGMTDLMLVAKLLELKEGNFMECISMFLAARNDINLNFTVFIEP